MTRYQVAFFDNVGRLQRIHDLTAIDQMRYSRKVNGIGQFLMALPRDLAIDAMREKDAMVQVYRTSPVTDRLALEGVYLLRMWDTPPGEPPGFVCAGPSPEDLLRRKPYDPRDDPLVANGYSTKSGYAVALMREIVQEQCVAPTFNTEMALPGFSVATSGVDSGPTAAFRTEFKKQSVLDMLTGLSDAHKLDWWIEYDSVDLAGYPCFVFYAGMRGTDWSKATHPTGPYVYLAPQNGTLAEHQLTVDAQSEANVVFVLAKGANGNRLIYKQTGDSVGDSPFNQIGTVVEASEADTADELLTAAATGLEENKAKTTFSFVPITTAGGSVYNLNWTLGDIVTVGDGTVEFTMRIVGIEITVQGGEQVITVETELWDS